MTLHQQIKDGVKKAMLAKDALRLSVLRGLLAAFTNEAVAQKRKPDEELNDEEALNVVRRGIKQRKDSIEQFKKGGREDLASAEEAELGILDTFVPAMMSKDEIRIVAEKKKAEMNMNDKSKMGMLVGSIMKDLKGKADGADVKAVVEALFG